jgi:hypothetical protein
VKHGTIDIPKDENAFTFYILASEQLKGKVPGSLGTTYQSWPLVPEDQIAYLVTNKAAIATWLEGTKRERACYHQPGKGGFFTMLPAVQEIRSFARMANLLATREMSAGKYDKAWEWFRANLRASRHCGQHGFVIQRLVGIACYASSISLIRQWAEDPKVDAKLLRQALNELIAITRMTAPITDAIYTEYYAVTNSLNDPKQRELSLFQDYSGKALTFGESMRRRATMASGVLLHEPERSRRVVCLMVANWLSAADLPAVERLKLLKKYGQLPLYEHTTGPSPALTNEALGKWCDSTLYARITMSSWDNIEKANVRDEAQQAALVVHLAEQIYLREKGKEVTSANDLIGTYLEALPVGYVPNRDLDKKSEPAN